MITQPVILVPVPIDTDAPTTLFLITHCVAMVLLLSIRVSDREIVTRGAMVVVGWIFAEWENGEVGSLEAEVSCSSIDGSFAKERETLRRSGVVSTRRTS